MIGSITAEWRKLQRRPAYLVAAGLVVAAVALVYAANYLQAAHPNATERASAALLRSVLYPAAFITNTIGATAPLGAAVAIVLGALGAGSEYSWGTLKTILTQRPGRLQTLAGRIVALSLAMAVLTVLLYGTAAVASTIVALIDGHAITWPAPLDIAKAVGSSWLILLCYALLGTVLGFLFRQAAAAVGIGIIYLVLLQTILVRFLNGVAGGSYHWATKALDGENVSSLIQSFGTAIPEPHAPAPLVDPTQAALVIGAYALLFAVLSAVLVARRDVT